MSGKRRRRIMNDMDEGDLAEHEHEHIIHIDGVIVGHLRRKASVEAGQEDPPAPVEHPST